jgi:biotin operon repressor
MQLPPLREREKRVLFYIRIFQWEKRYSPSGYDVAEMFQVKRQTIATIISSLRKKGYIEMSGHKHWTQRKILMPRGTNFPWGSEELPDYLFDHMKKRSAIEGSGL